MSVVVSRTVAPAPSITRAELAARYRAVRARSCAICAPLATDDYQVQAVFEASPPKWHLAHITWFFETFVLKHFTPDYPPFHPLFAHLFNSYYESLGSFHPRMARAALSRPTVEEVYRYRAHVDEAVLALIDAIPEARLADLTERLVLGFNHEEQHQELLYMDIKANFHANPMKPVYLPRPATAPHAVRGLPQWVEFKDGLVEIGHAGAADKLEKCAGFAFDNEQPRHRVFTEAFALSPRLVTNGEYLAFIEAGAYRQAQWWLSDGWRWVNEKRVSAPLYWERTSETGRSGHWHEFTLAGLLPLDLNAPVCHVSLYEADAYAHWAGVDGGGGQGKSATRLATEAELEIALASHAIAGNFAESGRLHPAPSGSYASEQWYGDAWAWTQSSYSPYPGFTPLAGSLGEYNGKFMSNQFVLRGGACVTPREHIRATYRNFFYAPDRWPFTGIRLARSL